MLNLLSLLPLGSPASLRFQKELTLFGGLSVTYVAGYGVDSEMYVGPIVAVAATFVWPATISEETLAMLGKNPFNFKNFILDVGDDLVLAEEINRIGTKAAEKKALFLITQKILRRKYPGPLVARTRPYGYSRSLFTPLHFTEEFVGSRFAHKTAADIYRKYMETAVLKNEIRNRIARKIF